MVNFSKKSQETLRKCVSEIDDANNRKVAIIPIKTRNINAISSIQESAFAVKKIFCFHWKQMRGSF
jgi:hypothetical protein